MKFLAEMETLRRMLSPVMHTKGTILCSLASLLLSSIWLRYWQGI